MYAYIKFRRIFGHLNPQLSLLISFEKQSEYKRANQITLHKQGQRQGQPDCQNGRLDDGMSQMIALQACLSLHLFCLLLYRL